MRAFVFTLFLIISWHSKAQTRFDTISVVSNAIRTCKGELTDLVMREMNRGRDAIFVRAESLSPNKYLYREVEFEDLVIIYTSELSMFHYGVKEFLDVTNIEINRRRARIFFGTRRDFNKRGRYVGRFKFVRNSGAWEFKSMALERAVFSDEYVPAWN